MATVADLPAVYHTILNNAGYTDAVINSMLASGGGDDATQLTTVENIAANLAVVSAGQSATIVSTVSALQKYLPWLVGGGVFLIFIGAMKK